MKNHQTETFTHLIILTAFPFFCLFCPHQGKWGLGFSLTDELPSISTAQLYQVSASPSHLKGLVEHSCLKGLKGMLTAAREHGQHQTHAWWLAQAPASSPWTHGWNLFSWQELLSSLRRFLNNWCLYQWRLKHHYYPVSKSGQQQTSRAEYMNIRQLLLRVKLFWYALQGFLNLLLKDITSQRWCLYITNEFFSCWFKPT